MNCSLPDRVQGRSVHFPWARSQLELEPLCGGYYRWPTRGQTLLICRGNPLVSDVCNDASSSLHQPLNIIEEFGSYPGVRINWDKSVLLPLYPSCSKIDMGSPLCWMNSPTLPMDINHLSPRLILTLLTYMKNIYIFFARILLETPKQ